MGCGMGIHNWTTGIISCWTHGAWRIWFARSVVWVINSTRAVSERNWLEISPRQGTANAGQNNASESLRRECVRLWYSVSVEMQVLWQAQYNKYPWANRFFPGVGVGRFQTLIKPVDIMPQLVFISRYTANSAQQIMGWPHSYRQRFFEALIDLRKHELPDISEM